MTITIDMPSGPMTVHKPSCIGAYYIIVSGSQRYLAVCLDANWLGKPKRMRIQHDAHRAGDVLMPRQYKILERADRWDD